MVANPIVTAEVTHLVTQLYFHTLRHQVADIDLNIMSRLDEAIKLNAVRLKFLSSDLGVEAYVDTSESSS